MALHQGKATPLRPPLITTLYTYDRPFIYKQSSRAISRYLWTAGIAVLLIMMFMVTIGIDEVGFMTLSILGIKEEDKSWSSSSSSAQDIIDMEMKRLLNEHVKYYSEQPEHERYRIVSKCNAASR